MVGEAGERLEFVATVVRHESETVNFLQTWHELAVLVHKEPLGLINKWFTVATEIGNEGVEQAQQV